jgi:hypothetical protein
MQVIPQRNDDCDLLALNELAGLPKPNVAPIGAGKSADLGVGEAKPAIWSFINIPSNVKAGASNTARALSKASLLIRSHLRNAARSCFVDLGPLPRLAAGVSCFFIFA